MLSTKQKCCIQLSLIIYCLFTTAACKEKSQLVNEVKQENKTVEKHTSPSLTNGKTMNLITVTGSVNIEKSCGAMPTFDKKSCQEKQPAGLSFILIHQNSQKQYTITSDTNGQFSSELPQGQYRVQYRGPFSVTPQTVVVSENQTAFDFTFRAMLR
ncbi:carboxypeptidase-like regulatory domain-containing protein [Aliikangiella maris]|uniref:Carboxypeptidase-like regulatory domain-containing protein n=2 Tax=Aliikangiella maris TaxID=3162458 RepID=A0ABV3MTP1_9GAMM